jgi:NDP-sugar pyrophosphorylase family protein
MYADLGGLQGISDDNKINHIIISRELISELITEYFSSYMNKYMAWYIYFFKVRINFIQYSIPSSTSTPPQN